MSNQIQSPICSDPVTPQQEQPSTVDVNETSSPNSLEEQVVPQQLANVVITTVPSTDAFVSVLQAPVDTQVSFNPTISTMVPAAKSNVTSKSAVSIDYPEVTGIPDADRVLKNVPAAHQIGIQRLLEYCVKMNPSKPIEIQEGVKAQVALFRIIQNTINREDTYFRQLFAAILALFAYEKTGVFKEENVFRFMDSITLNDVERKAFTRLINLVKLLGPKESRAVALKQVNFTSSLQYGLTDEGRQRVLGFFNVTK